MKASIKITDSSQIVSIGSRAYDHWNARGYNQLYKELRPGLKFPKNLNHNNIDSVVKQFQLKGIAFGNWCNTEDKLNYLHALFIAFYDLNKVLRFGYNIGLKGNLSVTFGDRGTRSGIAHFSPNTVLININRYVRGTGDKTLRFLTTGGIHSFAHEYGHFLDYFSGAVLEKTRNSFSCSGWGSIARHRSTYDMPIRKKFDDILEKIIFKKGKLSPYYSGLLKQIAETEGIGDYWIERCELFARAFESYVQYELEEMGIKNLFLTSRAYNSWAYVPKAQLVSMVPDFRALIKLIRAKI